MKSYSETLENTDAITVKTYYKCPVNTGMTVRTMNVYVASINIEAGTVNARIGETDSYIDYKKQELFEYINLMGFSNTE